MQWGAVWSCSTAYIVDSTLEASQSLRTRWGWVGQKEGEGLGMGGGLWSVCKIHKIKFKKEKIK